MRVENRSTVHGSKLVEAFYRFRFVDFKIMFAGIRGCRVQISFRA